MVSGCQPTEQSHAGKPTPPGTAGLWPARRLKEWIWASGRAEKLIQPTIKAMHVRMALIVGWIINVAVWARSSGQQP